MDNEKGTGIPEFILSIGLGGIIVYTIVRLKSRYNIASIREREGDVQYPGIVPMDYVVIPQEGCSPPISSPFPLCCIKGIVGFLGKSSYCIPPPPEHIMPYNIRRWWDLIVKHATGFNLEPHYVASIITVESDGDPNALAYNYPKSTATGLMQITHSTAKLLGIDKNKLTDPDTNVYAGCMLLKNLFDRYRDYWKMGYGYYAGYHPHPDPKLHTEATRHADRIMYYYRLYTG